MRRTHLAVTLLFTLASCYPRLGLAAQEASAGHERSAVVPVEATINFWNRDIVTLRGTISGADSVSRAERAIKHIDELPLYTRGSDITLFPFNVEGQDGVPDQLVGAFPLQVDQESDTAGIALLLRVYSGRQAEEILATDPVFLKDLGLLEALSTNRGNGIAAMARKIREVAALETA